MRRSILVAAALVASVLAVSAQPAAGQTQAVQPPPAQGAIPGPYGTPIGIDVAETLIDRAQIEARRLNLIMAFAVTDPAGDLVAFARMDGVQTAAVQVAQDKARSAARFRRPTRFWADAIAGGRPQLMTLDGVIGAEGGVPVVDAQGRVIGGIGVSGGTGAQDVAVAEVALK